MLDIFLWLYWCAHTGIVSVFYRYLNFAYIGIVSIFEFHLPWEFVVRVPPGGIFFSVSQNTPPWLITALCAKNTVMPK
jgi:hypothetical protein